MISITKQIETTVDDIPGWSPVDQLSVLYLLTVLTAPLGGDVLEIGSWCGRSSVVLGMAVRDSGVGVVHCVDLFPELSDWYQNSDGSYSFTSIRDGHSHESLREHTAWAEPFQRDILPTYERFGTIRNAFNYSIKSIHLESVIRAYAMNSSMFIKQVTGELQARIAFIDADHSYESLIMDIDTAETVLISGGWICFDDAFSHFSGVDRAITERIINSDNYELCTQITRKMFIARRRIGVGR